MKPTVEFIVFFITQLLSLLRVGVMLCRVNLYMELKLNQPKPIDFDALEQGCTDLLRLGATRANHELMAGRQKYR